jgi:hypothetical protein
MKKTLDQVIEESLNKESIFPMDSPATAKKVLTVPYPGENEEDEEQDLEQKQKDEDVKTESLQFSKVSRLYIEGKISDKQIAKFIITENKQIINELDLAKVSKFTMAFLRALRIVKKVSSSSNPLVTAGISCGTYICRKLLIPRLIGSLKDSLVAITTKEGKENVHKVISVLQNFA